MCGTVKVRLLAKRSLCQLLAVTVSSAANRVRATIEFRELEKLKKVKSEIRPDLKANRMAAHNFAGQTRSNDLVDG